MPFFQSKKLPFSVFNIFFIEAVKWTIDVAPTDTTPGSKSHHCTVCDAKTDVTVIPATGTKKSGVASGEAVSYTHLDVYKRQTQQ